MKKVLPVLALNVMLTEHAIAQNRTIDITNSTFGAAVGDGVVGITNCTITQASLTVTCPAPATYPTVNSKSMLVSDDAGSSDGTTGGSRIPYVGTIGSTTLGLSGVLTLTLTGTAPVFSNAGSLLNHVASLAVDGGGTTGGYTFNSTQTLCPCTTSDGVIPAKAHPTVMRALAVLEEGKLVGIISIRDVVRHRIMLHEHDVKNLTSYIHRSFEQGRA